MRSQAVFLAAAAFGASAQAQGSAGMFGSLGNMFGGSVPGASGQGATGQSATGQTSNPWAAFMAGGQGATGTTGTTGITGSQGGTSNQASGESGAGASQAAPASSAGQGNAGSAAQPTQSAAAPASNSGSSSSGGSSSGGGGGGGSYKASFTEYGSGDQNGSPNCNTQTTACGFYTSPGYSAAVSQNEFGVGPGAGAGPACGNCWKLTANTNSGGQELSNAGNSIVVQITNLCPSDGNTLCSQQGLSGTNQYGANINFDLCSDSGAAGALFGSSGVGLAVGTAEQVDCSQWSGQVVGG